MVVLCEIALSKNPVDGFSVGLANDNDIYEWTCMMEGPPGTDYEGGYFPCTLSFPKEYPYKQYTYKHKTQAHTSLSETTAHL
jgi:ubiquitin-conjugating enzyme E2 G1